MKARDVLVAAGSPWRVDAVVAVLLAQTPEGEGVYIAPDGTLMRVEVLRPGSACTCAHHHWSACTTGQGCPCLTETFARLVPIEEEP